MWAAVVEVKAPARLRGEAEVLAALRYAGVLAVWLGLYLVRPALARDVWRERRADSPIPRRA